MAADVSMLGLRDVLLVTPAATFHHTQHHHHLHHHRHDSHAAFASSSASAASEHALIPLLAATHCPIAPDAHDPFARTAKPSPASAAAGLQFWQPQPLSASPQQQNPNPNPGHGGPTTISYLKKPVPMLEAAGILGAAVSGGSGGAATCQDCGNQAKKDCIHRRCRACCKSRGFECSTHVKSTWVPAARRRERQQQQLVTAAAGSSASTSAPKKPRLLSSHTTTTSHTSTSTTTPPRSFDTSSSHQDASFRESLPRYVRAPAVFKCVRVTSIDDGEDEYAYQAAVSIGGHVFKGFLYDVGVDDGRSHDLHPGAYTSRSNDDHPGGSGASASGIPNMSELHLGGTGGGGRDGGASSSSPMLPSDVYGGGGGSKPPGSGAGFLGGAGFGNPMN